MQSDVQRAGLSPRDRDASKSASHSSVIGAGGDAGYDQQIAKTQTAVFHVAREERLIICLL